MDLVPLAWRPGIVAAALVLLGCVIARPSSVVRTYHRIRRGLAVLGRFIGDLCLLAEHRVTRWRRSRQQGPIAVATLVSELAERRLIAPSDRTRARLVGVPRVKRGIAITLVASAFLPSAAWVAMNRWPSSPFGRTTQSAFAGWKKVEDRVRLGRGSKVAAQEQARTTVTSAPVRDVLAWHRVDHDEPVLFGSLGDEAAPADYDGDGLTDLAAYTTGTGAWSIVGRAEPIELGGEAGDVPVPGDYDGNGAAEPAVFRPSTGEWLVDGATASVVLGGAEDVPVPGRWTAAATTIPAVFRPSTGQWLVSGREPVVFGDPGDLPAPADYDGDGVLDLGVFRPSTGEWWVLGLAASPIAFGKAGDVPLPGRYLSDPHDAPAVYRPSTGEVLVVGHESFVTGYMDRTPVLLHTADGLVPATVVPAG